MEEWRERHRKYGLASSRWLRIRHRGGSGGEGTKGAVVISDLTRLKRKMDVRGGLLVRSKYERHI